MRTLRLGERGGAEIRERRVGAGPAVSHQTGLENTEWRDQKREKISKSLNCGDELIIFEQMSRVFASITVYL